ncbi:radical SAM protein [Methanolobus chelungpuianus]|uniref:Pyrroloquinoline quinone biosynthesis protein PqqE n=1 Tax=Methanolobus chelungpuianus TaxID=502115 RepID=A0AAE3H8T7_9EURY|nr:radical SAM protein [Methanolobus chelungpuianus]MCQ6961737.1 pyrroloquinoline quinone biosynthesis protein PqqE [Methanolobus chelungpuianus]
MANFSPITAAKALWQMRIRKRPFVLSHAVNSSCNMQCSFCEYWKEKGPQMGLEEIFRLLDEARDFGIQVYNAWTVEPLLRKDLPQIFEHAKSLGMTTSMITNGLLLEKRAEELVHLDYLSVSVDGTSSYKDIRGIDFDRILPGIIRARQVMGKPLLLNCVISGKNLDDIRELIELARDHDLKISFEPMYEFGGIAGDTWDELGIRDMDKYRATVDRIIEMKGQGYPIINSLTYLTMVRDLRTDYKCHASDLILCVAADGSIENCRVHRQPLGNISEGIASVWERTREERRIKAENCGKCLFFGYVENSLLYDFNLEVMRHYDWM